jgi:hypothetical protein
MGTKKTETQTLVQWLIGKIDSEGYRAGKISGMMHPKADQKLLNDVGGLEALITQARELEQSPRFRGRFRVKWRDMGRDLEKMDFSVDIMDDLCAIEGLEEPRKHQIWYIEQMEILQKDAPKWLFPYYEHLLEQLHDGKLIRDVNKNRGAKLDDRDFFRCLNAIAADHKPVWKRVFSAAVFRQSHQTMTDDIDPSKRFERCYQTRIYHVLKQYSPFYKEGMDEDTLLAAHGILSYSQTLEWKGPLSYRLENAVIDTSVMRYGTVLNTQTLERAEPMELSKVRRIMTIENKANYESMPYREDTLYLYCHGFFSPRERRFLKKLVQIAALDTEYLHWGDMDYGGICIFRFIQEELFPKLQPYRMGREDYEQALLIGAGTDLEPEKYAKYEQLDAGPLEELRQCILTRQKEIEQEILLAEEYKICYTEETFR